MSDGDDGRRPLDGVRVIEASMIVAGPFCGSVLAEFGAEVIKIENPGEGDPLRNMVTTKEGDPLWFASTGRNKKSVTLALGTPEGARIFTDLVRSADVLLQGFRPGVFERWGIDLEALMAEKPELIVLNVSGYGQTGPMREVAGFGRTCQAFAGLTGLTGFPDRPPVTAPYPLGDYAAGLFGTIGVMMALYERDAKKGRGQTVDVSLFESVFRQLEFLAPEREQLGRVRERAEPFSAHSGPTGTWQARDGKWVAITCSTNAVFKRFAQAVGKPDLAEHPDFATQKKRKEQEYVLSDLIAEWLSSKDGKEAVDVLNAHNVPTSLCMTIEDMVEDPQYQAREAIVAAPHPRFGSLSVNNVVPKLSRTPGRIDRLGPDLGEHTDAVLADLLGYDDQRLQELRNQGVI